MLTLPSPSSSATYAAHINDSGEIVGSVVYDFGNGSRHAALWDRGVFRTSERWAVNPHLRAQ